MKITSLATLLFAAIVLLCNCTKEVQGPQGESGPQGPRGPAGPAGPEASPAYNYDFILTFDDSLQTDTFRMPVGSMQSRATFIYLEYDAQNWVALPWTLHTPGFVPVAFWAECDQLNERIVVHTDRGDSQAGSPWGSETSLNFRAVTVELTAGRSRLDFTDYNAVKAAYGLPD